MGSILIETSASKEIRIVRPLETVDINGCDVKDLPLPPVEEKEKSE